jgi:glucokinase
MAIKNKDKLCMKVVEKFTENLGTETGNLALKTLPFGGIYLIGGVTAGIKEYLIKE